MQPRLWAFRSPFGKPQQIGNRVQEEPTKQYHLRVTCGSHSRSSAAMQEEEPRMARMITDRNADLTNSLLPLHPCPSVPSVVNILPLPR